MEHLALEIFDLDGGTGSKFAWMPEDASITITDTSEIFASGNVWSHSFTLNIYANAHIFGTAGEIHGSRLHEQINKRRTRLWVEGLPFFLGYLKLDDEVDVEENGNVDVTFESGQKTFEEMIEGTKAREVSVGDVVIGVALNRKRVSNINIKRIEYDLRGLEAFISNYPQLKEAYDFTKYDLTQIIGQTPYTQQWPKLVKSSGTFLDSTGTAFSMDYTNIKIPYDARHPFCNINICYPYKSLDESGEEKSARSYTMRLAHGTRTTDGSDNQTRFNNAPNFYLLYFIKRLFKDLGIYIEENEMENVEDLRRVFMLNFGCHYEEIENASLGNNVNYLETTDHLTPSDLLSRYGQYYIQIISENDQYSLVKGWDGAGQYTYTSEKRLEYSGKVLLRNFNATLNGTTYLQLGSVEGIVNNVTAQDHTLRKQVLRLDKNAIEYQGDGEDGYYSAYLAYATGDNYPNVDISEIIEAMKSMFGVRLLFSDNYKRVRIILLRNVFKSTDIQEIRCEIVDEDVKQENCIRGFRMTYGKGTDDTNFYYKGFNDLFPRQATIWKDTTDKHDYTQWYLNADYATIKQSVSPSNKVCYVTPVNGNAYGVKIDEDEDVLFPSLYNLADFMDAEDGDCSGDDETIKEVQCGASPVIMNNVNNSYAVLFKGDLSAPSPKIDGTNKDTIENSWGLNTWRSTYARVVENQSMQKSFSVSGGTLVISGNLDVYLSEGFRIRLLDNYGIGNGGTPFDEADPGLCFGIMRSSGRNAYVGYKADEIEHEDPMNDYWEVVPGDGAIDHPDTCNEYGEEWDYDGSQIIMPSEAPAKLEEMFPDSDAPFYNGTLGYITGTTCMYFNDSNGERHFVLLASEYSVAGVTVTGSGDMRYFGNLTLEELQEVSRTSRHVIVEVDSSYERGSTLVQLCKLAYGGGTRPMRIDNGVGSRYGRFSLKLRAEKPNPYFDPTNVISSYNRRYIPITNENLRQRGLCDQFYKEYSYWIRNARIVKRTVRMELAQLLTIDKTKRVTVGDVKGFIRKIQYSVSNKTGLGEVTMEIMYI